MYSLEWPYTNNIPQATAQFKLIPEDFHVNEFITEEFSGSGEHLFIKIEKKGINTEDVIKSISRLIAKPSKLISYAGLKDRHSVSTQWLSIHAPGEHIEGIEQLSAPGWRVVQSARHHKKIRPGFLSKNQFRVVLRNVTHMDELVERIDRIKYQGVPNYFGEQRFGRESGNLIKAEELLVQHRKVKDRFLKGIYYSAARSWIFNLILAKRVQAQCWNIPLSGDVMQLSGSNSIFTSDAIDETILQRIKAKDISPATPLPGKGKMIAANDALELINQIYCNWESWIQGLEQHGLEQSWRPNILHIEELQYAINDQTAELSFKLPPGAYATTVLRELVNYKL